MAMTLQHLLDGGTDDELAREWEVWANGGRWTSISDVFLQHFILVPYRHAACEASCPKE